MVGRATGDIGDLIKIPPILADAALGWLVWSMIQELGGRRRSALIGAALVVANPVSWFDRRSGARSIRSGSSSCSSASARSGATARSEPRSSRSSPP